MTKRRRSLSCWRLGRPFPLIWVALILCSLDVLVLFCTTFLVLRFLQVRSGHYSVRWNPARTLGRMGVQQPGCIRMEKWKIGYACINRDFRSNIKGGPIHSSVVTDISHTSSSRTSAKPIYNKTRHRSSKRSRTVFENLNLHYCTLIRIHWITSAIQHRVHQRGNEEAKSSYDMCS